MNSRMSHSISRAAAFPRSSFRYRRAPDCATLSPHAPASFPIGVFVITTQRRSCAYLFGVIVLIALALPGLAIWRLIQFRRCTNQWVAPARAHRAFLRDGSEGRFRRRACRDGRAPAAFASHHAARPLMRGPAMNTNDRKTIGFRPRIHTRERSPRIPYVFAPPLRHAHADA
jgi:hypothetical protein